MKVYRTIGSYCEVFIPSKKQPKTYKVKARIEPRRLLAVLRSKTYLVYVPTKNTMTKTPFIKLYKPKNPLTLKRVSKPIRIRPLNDVAITKDSTGQGISLDLLEIDDIGSLKSITPEAPGPPKPPELLALGPSKSLKPKNKPLELMFRPPEELIKPVDSLNPDEI